MAGAYTKKRSHADSTATGRMQRPNKKQRKASQYHSDSEEDLDNALVDDLASLSGTDGDSGSEADTSSFALAKKTKEPTKAKKGAKRKLDEDEDESDSEGGDVGVGSDSDVVNGGEQEQEEDDDEFANSEGETSNFGSKRQKSKRNDPGAFATSLQKILSTVIWHLGTYDDDNLLTMPCA